ncbi:hypothetical protein [Nonomuraea sp. KM88]|uniref:hypothetical protein n=1 Tax=Nonomuraea sp. KM88 TaxID=3457427 RepID=UPI003FCD54D8
MAIKDTLRAMDESGAPKFRATDEEKALTGGDREMDSMFEYQRSFVVTNINEA